MMITIELTEEQAKKVELFKAVHSLSSKADAVAEIIEEFKFDVKVSK